jgi:hypothetical protein
MAMRDVLDYYGRSSDQPPVRWVLEFANPAYSLQDFLSLKDRFGL